MPEYKNGDEVVVTLEGKIIVDEYDDGSFSIGKGGANYITPSQDHVVSVLVTKPAKPPKPQVGDVRSGAEVKATWWKRGTLLRDVEYDGWYFLLNEDGTWYTSKDFGHPQKGLTFDSMPDDLLLRVAYLP